jgi:hypothetical protein
MSRIISQNEKVLYQNQEVISQNKILLGMLQKTPEALPEDDASLFETDSLTEEVVLSDIDIDELDSINDTVSYADSSYADTSYADTSYADTESLVSEVSSVLPRRKLKKSIKKLPSDFLIIDEEKNSYTPEEVEEMNDCELSINFSRIVGQTQLYCNHCHRQKSLEYWIHSIRKRCLKKDGLCATMTVPKTCDHQQAVNSICNPVNNRVYPTMRNPNASERTKHVIMESKANCFEKMGKEINPYKYIPVSETITGNNDLETELGLNIKVAKKSKGAIINETPDGEIKKKRSPKHYDRIQQFKDLKEGLELTISYKDKTATYIRTANGVERNGITYKSLMEAGRQFYKETGREKQTFNAWVEFKVMENGKKVSVGYM